MKQLKCENCGATIKIDDNDKEYGTCPYCKAKYQLNEKKDINIKIDDNTKELLTNGFSYFKKTSKIAIIPIIVFALIIITAIILTSTQIFSHTNISTNNKNTTSETNNINNIINNTKKEINKSSFNSKFEIRSGTKYKSSIEYLLDDVITNNKTNKDMLVTVTYKDNETTDPDTIINIKHSLEDWKKYEVKLDYDEDGYVNKVTIEDI